MVTAREQIGQNKVTLDSGVEDALRWAGSQQDHDGSWCGMLESNACMEAEWLLSFHIMGYEYEHEDALVRGILERQRTDAVRSVKSDRPAAARAAVS